MIQGDLHRWLRQIGHDGRSTNAAAEARSEAGHWEGDLIIGAANRPAVATLTERLSRLTLTVALPDGYDAERNWRSARRAAR